MQKAHDFDEVAKRGINITLIRRAELTLDEESLWLLILEPVCICAVLLCLWRAAALVVNKGESWPASRLDLSFSRLLVFLLLLGFAWHS
jgi:hypothetical protein